ncbi:MAG TPA: GAF domain-containing protein, partial [Nitrospiria bacterium]|nr:GAF domain-containing protein [Nitrospiria bacterium]
NPIQQLSALNHLSGLISQSRNLKKALNNTIDQLLRLTRADIGTVHLLEEEGEGLRLAVWRGVSDSFRCAEERIPLGDCLCGEAASTGNVVASFDLENDSRLSRGACRQERFGSVISIPLKSVDRTVGILTVYSSERDAFKKREEDLLALIGQEIGVAIENGLLYQKVRRLAVEEERGNIAKEIHDGVAQSLAFLNLETRKLEDLLKREKRDEALTDLGEIRQVIKDTYEDVRELLVDFRMKFKGENGFYDALASFTDGFQHRTGIQVLLSNRTNGAELSPDCQIQLFRVVQEALSNIRKHSRAGEVHLSLLSTPTHLEVRIKDNGRGFDPEEVSSRKQLHMGIEIMKERVAQLKGGLFLKSNPGEGTTLQITVPLNGSGFSG